MIGLNLAQYRIEDELGRGGMGIVYRATDTKLNRKVALKVLPPSALGSEDDRARFFREAQAAAQLHHPNIATVFGIDEAAPHTEGNEPQEGAEKRPFIAMEYIEGETLHDRIARSPLKLAEAVSIAVQVAEALKAAHAKQIVHRDVKSTNVMLTPDGVAKVLDFGLAKTQASTMLTRQGSTLGTVAYMSPEQARGQEVDGRTDLYSLGTVLYEMVAGRLPFAGDYEQAILYGILNEPPEPLTALRTGVPMDLERLVNKLLTKEADYRYQTAADLIADLKSLDLTGSGHSRRPAPIPISAHRAAEVRTGGSAVPGRVWGALLAVAAAAAGVTWLAKPAPPVPEQPVVRFSLELPDDEPLLNLGRHSIAISPDGTMIAYTAGTMLLTRRMDDLDRSIPIQGTEVAREVFFSPDGKWIAYEQSNRLMRVSASGGAPMPITDLPAEVYGASWGDDGRIYVGLGSLGLGRVRDGGGELELFRKPESTQVYDSPRLLPGGEWLMYLVATAGTGWNSGTIQALSLVTGETRDIRTGGRDARYLASGHLVFFWNGSLYAAPFDLDRMEMSGGFAPVAGSVHGSGGITGAAQYDVSRQGTLVAIHGAADEGEGSWLKWVFQDRSVESLSPDRRNFVLPRLSPDGSQIAVEITQDVAPSVWVFDAARGTGIELAAGGERPIWSPDGDRVAYSNAGVGILVGNPASPEGVDTLLVTTEYVEPTSWSPDGKHILFNQGPLLESDLYVLDVESGNATPFLESDADVDFGRFSPDGQWIVYESMELESRNQVFVRRFPSGANRFRISVDGGQKPEWSPDGRRIYWMAEDNSIVRAAVDLATGKVGMQEPAYGAVTSATWGFAVHPGDERLLVRSTSETGASAESDYPRFDFTINWTRELNDRVSPDR